MNMPARRVRGAAILAVLAVLVVAGCGSGAPSASVGSTPIPTTSDTGTVSETPSPEPSTGGLATIPDPCALLPKTAIDAILGASADAGTQTSLANDAGLVCAFVAENGASFNVTIENGYASAADFTDALDFGTTEVPGLGEAARFIYSDVGTPPSATLWVYAHGLSIGTTLWKPGLTEAAALDLLKTMAAEFVPGI